MQNHEQKPTATMRLTLEELLDYPNNTIKRNAMSIYKTLQRIQMQCSACNRNAPIVYENNRTHTRLCVQCMQYKA